MNRFEKFNPAEREILRILMQNHLNSVSEIALRANARVGEYLACVEKLEREIKDSYND